MTATETPTETRPMDRYTELYVIISTDRVTFGRRVRPSDVADLLDRYAPASILPDAWPAGALLEGAR